MHVAWSILYKSAVLGIRQESWDFFFGCYFGFSLDWIGRHWSSCEYRCNMYHFFSVEVYYVLLLNVFTVLCCVAVVVLSALMLGFLVFSMLPATRA